MGALTRPSQASSTRVSISGETHETPGIRSNSGTRRSSSEMTTPDRASTVRCGLKFSIFSCHMSPKPVMTARTMTTIATPSITPVTDTQVMTDVSDRFGFRYLAARNTGNVT